MTEATPTTTALEGKPVVVNVTMSIHMRDALDLYALGHDVSRSEAVRVFCQRGLDDGAPPHPGWVRPESGEALSGGRAPRKAPPRKAPASLGGILLVVSMLTTLGVAAGILVAMAIGALSKGAVTAGVIEIALAAFCFALGGLFALNDKERP